MAFSQACMTQCFMHGAPSSGRGTVAVVPSAVVVLLNGISNGGVYTLSCKPIPALLVFHASGDLWHCRLGYCESRVLEFLSRKQFIKPHSKFSRICVSCKLGKVRHSPFNDAEHLLWDPLPLFHSIICWYPQKEGLLDYPLYLQLVYLLMLHLRAWD